MSEILILSPEQIAEIFAHVEACAPEEGCGLLAGRSGKVELTILITNQLHSPVRYNMEPKELIKAFCDIEVRGMELLAVFHSHLKGPSTPSGTDLAEYTYIEAHMIILSKETGFWRAKGFKIEGGTYEEIVLRID